MTELIICEKPSAAQKVAAALADGKLVKKANKKVPYYELNHAGNDVIVACAVGHLYGVAQKGSKGWDYPVFETEWQPTYKMTKGSSFVKDYVDTLKMLAKKADAFTLACDYDIEGEVIGYNALRFACGQKDGQRMKFSALTKGDLVDAYANKSKTIDWGQAKAGETRHILDWFYGINLSRALTASIKAAASFKVMSIGRVQGPALKMIVDREREILAFVPVPFWQIQMLAKAKQKTTRAAVSELRAKPEEFEAWHYLDKFWKKEEAMAIFEKIKKEKKAMVTEVKKTQHQQTAPYPFDLTTLQTESYAHHRISPKETLALAQKLYLAGVISYPRTSSQQLHPKLGFDKILGQLKNQQLYAPLVEMLTRLGKLEPHNGEKTDPAHPAIYPTGNEPPELTPKEQKVYDLIVKRFLATFGPDATRENLSVAFDVLGEKFLAEGKRTVVPGWHIYYRPYVKFKEIELPEMKQDDAVDVATLSLLDKETPPPKRFTPSSIIKELERRNLGTKSTRAEIVDTLQKRGYTEGKQIKATQFGLQTASTLEKYSPDILNEDLTRGFEDDMERIREGKKDEEGVLAEAQKVLVKILTNFKKHEKEVGMELLTAVKEAREEARTIGVCPICKKGMLRVIMSRKTKKQFLACGSYPECTTTFALPQQSLILAAATLCAACGSLQVTVIRKAKRPQVICISAACPSKKLDTETQKQVDKIESGKIEKTCPKCSAKLVLRKSFYGEFLGCSTYPKCRHTESLAKNAA